MKKVIFLISILLLLCGCTADVNLTIDDDILSEDISINYFADELNSKDDILHSFREYIPVYNNVIVADTEDDIKQDGIEYYKRNVKDLGTGYNFDFKYDYPLVSYNGARSVRKSFKSFSLIKNAVDNTITLSTDTSGLKIFEEYDELSNVNIKISTNNEVLETNGKYENGVYIWTFNRNDYKKNIYMKMKINNSNNNVYNNSKKEKEESAFSKLVNKNPIVSVVVGILLFVLVIVILNKISKKNK